MYEYICVYVHTYMHAYIHTYIHADRETDIYSMHIYIYI